MILVAGGGINTGSNNHYPEERPVRMRHIEPFLLDPAPITNHEFTEFVAETGWRTQAERNDPAGSMVFTMTQGPVDLHNPAQWWRFVPGAAWHSPGGAGTSIDGICDHPVVHIAQADALAFAAWRDAR